MSAQFGLFRDSMVVATSGGPRVVYSCVRCGVLVTVNKTASHEAWHEQLDHEIAEAAGQHADPVPPGLVDRLVATISDELRKQTDELKRHSLVMQLHSMAIRQR